MTQDSFKESNSGRRQMKLNSWDLSCTQDPTQKSLYQSPSAFISLYPRLLQQAGLMDYYSSSIHHLAITVDTTDRVDARIDSTGVCFYCQLLLNEMPGMGRQECAIFLWTMGKGLVWRDFARDTFAVGAWVQERFEELNFCECWMSIFLLPPCAWWEDILTNTFGQTQMSREIHLDRQAKGVLIQGNRWRIGETDCFDRERSKTGRYAGRHIWAVSRRWVQSIIERKLSWFCCPQSIKDDQC